MEKTSKPKVAWILNIIAGALGLIVAVSYFIGFGVISGALGIATGPIPGFVPAIVLAMAIPSLLIAILALVGGHLLAQSLLSWHFYLWEYQLSYLQPNPRVSLNKFITRYNSWHIESQIQR